MPILPSATGWLPAPLGLGMMCTYPWRGARTKRLFIRGMGLSSVGVPSFSTAYASMRRQDLPLATSWPPFTTLCATFLGWRLAAVHSDVNVSGAFTATFLCFARSTPCCSMQAFDFRSRSTRQKIHLIEKHRPPLPKQCLSNVDPKLSTCPMSTDLVILRNQAGKMLLKLVGVHKRRSAGQRDHRRHARLRQRHSGHRAARDCWIRHPHPRRSNE